MATGLKCGYALLLPDIVQDGVSILQRVAYIVGNLAKE